MAEGLGDGGVEGGDGQNPEDFSSSDGRADNPFIVDGLSSREIYEQIAGIDAVLADEGYVFAGPLGATKIPKGLEPLTDSTASKLAGDEAAAQLYRPRLALQERFDQLVGIAEKINKAIPGFEFTGFGEDRTEIKKKQKEFLAEEFDTIELKKRYEEVDWIVEEGREYLGNDGVQQLVDYQYDIDVQINTVRVYEKLSEYTKKLTNDKPAGLALSLQPFDVLEPKDLRDRVDSLGGEGLKYAIETLDAAVKDMLPDNDENLIKLRDVIYSRYIAAAEHARSQETVMKGKEGDEGFKYTEFPLDLKPLTFEQRSAEIWRGLSPEARETALEHATNMANWYNRTLGLSDEEQVTTADFSIFKAETDTHDEEWDGQVLVGYTGPESKILHARLMYWKSLQERDSWNFQIQTDDLQDSSLDDDLRTYQTEANLRALSRAIPDDNLSPRGEAWLLLGEQRSMREKAAGKVPKVKYVPTNMIREVATVYNEDQFNRTSGTGEAQPSDGYTWFRAIRPINAN